MSLLAKPYELWMQNRHEGDVALELEVEGENLPQMRGDVWTSKADNSLKIGGVEYIHNGPKKIETVYETLRAWEAKLIKAKASIYKSDRTSVHVHSNVQNYAMKQILQSIIGYYMLEPVLMKHCGKSRKGNLFCLPMEDGVMVNDLIKALATGNTRGVNWDSYRYASLNMGAIKKFGSLEVRTMRGEYDPAFVAQWATNIKSIFDKAAQNFKSPVEVFDHYYGRSQTDFLGSFLTDDFIDVLRKYPDWNDRMSRNHIHLAPIVYETDWEKKEEKPKAPEGLVETAFDFGSTIPMPARLQRTLTPRYTEWVVTANSEAPYGAGNLEGWCTRVERLLTGWDIGYESTQESRSEIIAKISERYRYFRSQARVNIPTGTTENRVQVYDREWDEWTHEDNMLMNTAERYDIDHDLSAMHEDTEEEPEEGIF